MSDTRSSQGGDSIRVGDMKEVKGAAVGTGATSTINNESVVDFVKQSQNADFQQTLLNAVLEKWQKGDINPSDFVKKSDFDTAVRETMEHINGIAKKQDRMEYYLTGDPTMDTEGMGQRLKRMQTILEAELKEKANDRQIIRENSRMIKSLNRNLGLVAGALLVFAVVLVVITAL